MRYNKAKWPFSEKWPGSNCTHAGPQLEYWPLSRVAAPEAASAPQMPGSCRGMRYKVWLSAVIRRLRFSFQFRFDV